MAQTIAEKVLSEKSGKPVKAGEIAICHVDWALAQDGTGPLTIDLIEELGGNLSDPGRCVFFADHASPSPRRELSNAHTKIRDFAASKGAIFQEINEGVCHQRMAEAFVSPGELLVGADSHTCTAGALGAFATGMGSTDIAIAMSSGKTWLRVPESIKVILKGRLGKGVSAKDAILHLAGLLGAEGANYQALEFSGEIDALSMPQRLTLSNMAVELGAKAGLFPTDKETNRYLESYGRGVEMRTVAPDKDAAYAQTVELDLSAIVPMIAMPHQVDQVKTVQSVAGKKIEQVFIGSCTNGRIEDLEEAASLIKGKKVNKEVRLIVTPASKDVYLRAIESGAIKTLVESGAFVTGPGCGVCVGVHGGVLGDGESCVATTNRNFQGRMGNPEGFVFLASPLTAAASAIRGEITDPRDVMEG